LVRDVIERLHQATGDTAVTEIRLDDLAHPLSLERRLRAARGRTVVPGGQVQRGNFRLAADQSLRGDLLVLDGDVEVFGRLDGNLVAWDGSVVVHPGAVVTGDVLAFGGDVKATDGDVGGEIRTLSLGGDPVAPAPALSPGAQALRRVAGVLGVFLTLFLIGGGLVVFARTPLETVSDTVTHSFARSFVVGLLGQVLVLPTFGMLVVGLVLSVAGILLLPFVVVVFALLLVAAIVGGAAAIAHAMGETLSRRQMARGAAISPNGFRYLALGFGSVALLWLVWALLGWVPVAGEIMRGAAIIVSWLLASIGFGAALLSRGGLREQFSGRVVPPELLTDEYLWATPRFGVPAARRPDRDR
ncbi:MAG: polymer-forming cytoskeletal protein, partial [Gemmatimonadales bacterium]|nr:polymer-forming cytoskeletal protein [Gemmatimonadales bacterium]